MNPAFQAFGQSPHSEPLPRERDACGVGFVANAKGRASHQIVEMALTALANHAHRGAVAADGKSGDGAGLMLALPYDFLARSFLEVHKKGVPALGDLAVGMVFSPLSQAGARSLCRRTLEQALQDAGLEPLGWRVVPLDLDAIGQRARFSRPQIQQIFVGRGTVGKGEAFEDALYLARRQAERRLREAEIDDFYVASLSHRTIVYKGLCQAAELGRFYPDLKDPLMTSSVAVFHQRYSTNTFPSWMLAHPYRIAAHNGEFNTLEGNKNWMKARENALGPDAPEGLTPIIDERMSDSGVFDNVLEFFVRRRSTLLPNLLMLVPEIWENVDPLDMPTEWRELYRYYSCLMEAWDGPAAITFFDGKTVGTLVDRNGLRPVRYSILDDDLVLSASEEGVLDLSGRRVLKSGQLGPGEILVVDLEQGRVLANHEVKSLLAARRPYGEFNSERVQIVPQEVFYESRTSKESLLAGPMAKDVLQRRQLVFGYNHEDEIAVLRPMIVQGSEPIGSMGDDTPPAPLSAIERPLFHCFRQRFAQVTNPAIDPIRESLVMSLRTLLGRRANILVESPETSNLFEVPGPILSRSAFEYLNKLNPVRVPTIVLRSIYPVHGGAEALGEALLRLCKEGEAAVRQGASLIVLYDGEVNPFRAPIPSLLAVSALHQHLTECGQRLKASIIVASGEPREVHHFACLMGYGADAIYPFLALDSITKMVQEGGRWLGDVEALQARRNFIKAVEKGLLKIMAKMGISLLSSYRGAQVFEALGLSRKLVDRYFPGTVSTLGGRDLAGLAAAQRSLHHRAYGEHAADTIGRLASYGFYKYKKDGELHRLSPGRVKRLHKILAGGESLLQAAPEQDPYSVLPEGPEGFIEFARVESPPIALRDLVDFVRNLRALPLEQVESAKQIVARFSTGAMSHGSLSAEAHETLAIAMNRLGGASNSGEGGEAIERLGTEKVSKIKQIASGRFGVTPAYLNSAEELQIKISQGSKPGEGGQIPGHKVTPEIARIRGTSPGIALISPPPHHDIYSIEDLAQLIFDLKQVNSKATVSVKLVSEDGVGTIAAGVAKGFADIIHIGGSEGGTGASPLSSIKFAGMPWELGLAQAQQVLVVNRLRSKVRLRVDGGFLTGRDVVVAALLGADEFSFGTSALVAEGCLMARTCHTNRCPVGIASQDPKLRAKYPGTPESVMAYFLGVAHDVRLLLAELGFASLEEVIGHTELLEQVLWGKEAGEMDLSPLLWRPRDDLDTCHGGERNDPPAQGGVLSGKLLAQVEETWDGEPKEFGPFEILNTDRTVGAPISGWLANREFVEEIPAELLRFSFEGTAGQSFGAFCCHGLSLLLRGAANDYLAKGMSGGVVVVTPSDRARTSQENAIAGNTVLYGATGGTLLVSGRVGQRFAVRNSGAEAVVEGVGEHACEYMTGGVIVVLGRVGRNFAAGMTGGEAYLYVYETEDELKRKVNTELVNVEAVEDDTKLRELVKLHVERTGSTWAKSLLDDWSASLDKFRRVGPQSSVASIEARNEGVLADGRA
jgi:glutamate synthase (ferredoxin)